MARNCIIAAFFRTFCRKAAVSPLRVASSEIYPGIVRIRRTWTTNMPSAAYSCVPSSIGSKPRPALWITPKSF